MSAAQPNEFDTNLIAAFTAAARQAREFGFQIEKMKITLEVVNSNCVVHFEPVPEPGYVVLGGDLEVEVDFVSHQIMKARRGQ